MTIAKLFARSDYVIAGRVHQTQIVQVSYRLDEVRRCTSLPMLRQALDATDLQDSVRRAIEARIRRLERAAA